MRIGIEAQRIFRKRKHGMDIVALEMIRELQKMNTGHEFFVFVKKDADRCLEPGGGVRIIEVPGVTYPYWEQLMLPAAARKHKVDLLHCTSNTAPLGGEVPLLVTLHDIIYLEKKLDNSSKGSLYQRLGNVYRRYVVPKIVKKAEALITVSDYENKVISDFFSAEKPDVRTVYNGIGPKFFIDSAPEQARLICEKYNLPEEYLFFLGNTDPKKNLPNVIRACIKYLDESDNPLPVVIADYPESELKKWLKDAGKPELIKHFILPGYMANDDLPLIYNSCTLFLYPSLRESFGIPILEAQAAGAVVITSNKASMPEVSGDASVLIDPQDVEELAGQIRRLTGDENLRKTYIEKGKKNAARFSWRKTAEETLAIYEELIRN